MTIRCTNCSARLLLAVVVVALLGPSLRIDITLIVPGIEAAKDRQGESAVARGYMHVANPYGTGKARHPPGGWKSG